MTTAGVLLAAGASRRYGRDNKLTALLHGQPVICHAAQALRESEVDILIAVTHAPKTKAHLHGFDIVAPNVKDPEHSDSLRCGVHRAKQLGAARLVVVLADMPFVTPKLINQVIAATSPTTPATATDGQNPSPPAGFPASYFDALLAITGDHGAGSVLASCPHTSFVQTSAAHLFDIDTPEALRQAQAMRVEQ
ncbi:MAG: nucleotidyltransferase family protein [Pseudomonadota bacterium]